MSNLLEFLFSNWFILLAVYFIVKKLNDARKAAMSGGPATREPEVEEPYESRPVVEESPTVSLEENYNFGDLEYTLSSSAPAVPSVPEPSMASLAPVQEEKKATPHQLPSANRAAEGMMWAEVFSPPRAMRPYTPRRK